MDEPSLAKLLLALSSGDADRWQHVEGKTAPGADCPPLPRLRAAVLREDWTDAERRHKSGCLHCQQAERLVRRGVWHPSPAQLFQQTHPGHNDEDSVHHLRRDCCRRCERVADTLRGDPLLNRLDRRDDRAPLGRVLGSGIASREPLGAHALTFDDRNLSVTLGRGSRPDFHLERAGEPKSAARVLYALFGAGPSLQRHLLLPHPSSSSRNRATKIRLDAPPAERAPLILFEIEAPLLSADEAPLLRAALRQSEAHDPSGLPAWREWAAGALGQKELDGVIREVLVKMERGGGRPRER
jgi:hypothetical protein